MELLESFCTFIFPILIVYWLFYRTMPSLFKDAKRDLKELPILLEINNKELEKLKALEQTKTVSKRIKCLEKKNGRIKDEIYYAKNFVRRFQLPSEIKEGEENE